VRVEVLMEPKAYPIHDGDSRLRRMVLNKYLRAPAHFAAPLAA